VLVVEMMRFEPTTPCSQSQIEQDHDLRRQGAVQVQAAFGLSVVVRSGPVRTAVNGTLVARPHGATGRPWRRWLHLDRKGRPILGILRQASHAWRHDLGVEKDGG
jgi:hypothetical protein